VRRGALEGQYQLGARVLSCAPDASCRRFPVVVQVLLLLWKSVLYGWGGTVSLNRSKQEERKRSALPPLGPLDVKSSPTHLQALRQHATQFRKCALS
jgi:hypothetical protein